MQQSLLAAAMFAWILATAGCRPARPAERRELVPELVMEGVEFRVDRLGESRAIGEASRVTYRRDTTAVTASGLGLLLTDPAQGPIRIVAPSGQGVAAERRFEVAGGILAERGADQATTSSARFEPASSGEGAARGAVVRGEDPVLVEGPGFQLAGHGFRLDPATREITLGRGARLVAGLEGRR
jgi:lipopolysaccharide export system protein LptC